MEFWIVNLINGLSLGMIFFMLASGFTLILGLMNVLHLAYGSFYLLSAYIGFAIIKRFESFWLACFVGIFVGALLGWLMERLVLGPLFGRRLPQALATVGAAFFLTGIALWGWRGDIYMLPKPDFLDGSVRFLGLFFPIYRVFIIFVGVVLATGLWLFQEKTKAGAIVRAGVDDEEMARAMGINIRLVFSAVFVLASALAGLAGVLGGPILGAFVGAEWEVLAIALVVVIIGGMGSILGAFIGSLVIALLQVFTVVLLPGLSYFAVFAPMVIILALRPQGFFGKK
jgi:branched-chain amino acid transport system permease protein